MDVKRSITSRREGSRLWSLCVIGVIASLLITGCKAPQSCASRGTVSCELQNRVFHDVGTNSCPGEILIPPNVVLEDGLTEDEAVALALWNNRDFHATLSSLGIARGDLVQAGLLTNPQMNLFVPADWEQTT